MSIVNHPAARALHRSLSQIKYASLAIVVAGMALAGVQPALRVESIPVGSIRILAKHTGWLAWRELTKFFPLPKPFGPLEPFQVDPVNEPFVGPYEVNAFLAQLAIMVGNFRTSAVTTGNLLRDFRPDQPPPPKKEEKEK